MNKISTLLLSGLCLFSCSKTSKQENTVLLTINTISPINNSTVKQNTDTEFSWAVSGSDASEPVYYKIKIVEITQDQSPESALKTNKPIFEKDSIKAIKVVFPPPGGAGMQGLILDKKYVWQITGKQTLFTGSSDLSVFTVVR